MNSHVAGEKEPLFTREFNLLLMSNLMLITGVGVLYLFPLLILDLGGGQADIGYLMGAMSLSAVLARPWISGLVDQIGRKNSMAAACLLVTLVSIGHLFFIDAIENVFPFLVVLRILFGAGIALGIIASLTLATDLASGSRLNEGLGIFGIMPMLGLAIGPIIGESVMHQWGFDGMFLIAACFFICSFLFMIPLKEQFSSSAVRERGTFLRALQIPLVWRMAFICLCFGVAFAAHTGFVAPFAKTESLPVSAYFGFYSAGAILSRLFGSKLATRFGETRVIPLAMILAGIGFVCMTQVTTMVELIFTGFFAGVGHGLLFPSLLALTIRPIAARDRGKVTGILTGGFDSGMFLGSLVMGQLGEYLGFGMIFATAASTLFFGLGAFYWLKSSVNM